MPEEFRTGNSVSVLRVPDDVAAAFAAEARTVFRLAVGKTYGLQAVNEIGCLGTELAVKVDQALGRFGTTIWIEPDCVEAAAESGESEPGRR